MAEIEVLVPVAQPRVERHELAARLAQLGGATIGWLDNEKSNARPLLEHVAQELQGTADFDAVFVEKNATAAAPDNVMDRLKTCDAVVLAIAD